jgi:hypothetical protein
MSILFLKILNFAVSLSKAISTLSAVEKGRIYSSVGQTLCFSTLEWDQQIAGYWICVVGTNEVLAV